MIDKKIIKEIIKDMILDGEIKISKSYEDVYRNEGFFCGEEESLVLSVEFHDGKNNWDSCREVNQDHELGVVIEIMRGDNIE